MKRDWPLIRDILLALEEDRYREFRRRRNSDAVAYNVLLLHDAGLVDQDGCLVAGNSGLRLTMKGHDLLDSLRNSRETDKSGLQVLSDQN